MIKVLFICHGNILEISEKLDFTRVRRTKDVLLHRFYTV